MKNNCKVKIHKWLAMIALLLVGSMSATSFTSEITYYCGAGECQDVWSSAPTVPDDTCRMWLWCNASWPSVYCYPEQYHIWIYTETSEEGDPYDGTLKAWDDVRCDVYEGEDPYTATYATVSSSGTVKSVSHTWSAGLKWAVVKDVLELSAACSGTNSSSWHCDEGCSWSQPVTGTFHDGEYTKMYPEWIDTTITKSGPLWQKHYSGPPWELCCTEPLGAKTATKVERAVAATFKEVIESAKCLSCDEEDMWCNGSNCLTDCCDHAPE